MSWTVGERGVGCCGGLVCRRQFPGQASHLGGEEVRRDGAGVVRLEELVPLAFQLGSLPLGSPGVGFGPLVPHLLQHRVPDGRDAVGW